jgi:hypothetical protein
MPFYREVNKEATTNDNRTEKTEGKNTFIPRGKEKNKHANKKLRLGRGPCGMLLHWCSNNS